MLENQLKIASTRKIFASGGACGGLFYASGGRLGLRPAKS